MNNKSSNDMKKGTLTFLMTLLLSVQLHSQVANWIIQPYYDSIYFDSGSNFIITDSLNEKSVWTQGGKRIFKTKDNLHPFSEGFAVTTEKGSDKITGFYNSNDGSFIPLEGYSVAHNYPFFSDGYLVVKRNDKYYFTDTKGQLNKHGVVLAYPFHHGFASCRDYENPNKPKDKEIYNFLIDKNMQKQSFLFNGKAFSHDDVEFISSINNKGKGIVVAKHKVYYFKEQKELEPVYPPEEEKNSKNQIKLNRKITDCLIELNNSEFVLYLNNELSCLFDARMIPLEIGPNLKRIPFDTLDTTKEKNYSPIVITKKNNLVGISIDNIVILPPQFEAIYDCFDNNAFVKMSGKQGLVHVSKDDKFRPSINDGKDIGFRHQTFNTTIRLDMPSFVPSNNTYIESLDSICLIDQLSRDNKNTDRGNFIEYTKCSLKFPQNLTDEIAEISYPIQIVSDGLKFPVVILKANAWHYKYFTIQINEKSVSKGTASFTFDIIAERFSDDDVYPFVVNIETDSTLFHELENLSSIRYKCTLYDLQEGSNDITIEILEKGCPPISSTYSFIYNKPSSKNKHKESVDIKKKTEEDDFEDNDGIVPGL